MWTVPSRPDWRAYVNPSASSSRSTDTLAIGSSGVGGTSSLANGNKSRLFAAVTSNALRRLLALTPRGRAVRGLPPDHGAARAPRPRHRELRGRIFRLEAGTDRAIIAGWPRA